MSEQFEERELSDSELENISGGLHHWHPGFGLGLGLGLGGGVFGFGGGVPVVFGGASGSCGSQPTFVAVPQPQVVEVVQQPAVQTVQTTGTSYQLVSTGGC
jgi:bacteriocin-like protein